MEVLVCKDYIILGCIAKAPGFVACDVNLERSVTYITQSSKLNFP